MAFELLFGAVSGLDLFFVGVALVISQGIGEFIPQAPSAIITSTCLLVLYFALFRKIVRKPLLFFLQKLGIDVLIGAEVAVCSEAGEGKKNWVLLHGEVWQAKADFPVKPNQKAWVSEVKMGTLILSKNEE